MLARVIDFTPEQIGTLEAFIEATDQPVGPVPTILTGDGELVVHAGLVDPEDMPAPWPEPTEAEIAAWPAPWGTEAERAAWPTEAESAAIGKRLARWNIVIDEDETMKTERDETIIDLDAARDDAKRTAEGDGQEKRDAQPTPSLRPMFDIVHDVGAELSWQADGLTPHGGIMLFAGGKSAGKSTLARTYALAVARGDPFLGREVEQGPVVVASLEDPIGVSSEHWHLLGLREDDPVFGWDGQLPEDPAAWLSSVHREVQPGLILIDSFGRWTRGKASMNSYDEIIAVTEDVLAFCRATKCVVAFTHHIRKGGGDDVSETVSGSMALIGLMDTTFHLLRNGDGTRSIQTTQRAGESMETTALVFDAGRLTLGGVVWKNKAKEAEAKVMLHVPGDGAWICNQEVLKKCGGNKQAIVRALQNLVKEGVLDVQGIGTKIAPKEFRLRTVGSFEI